MVTKLGFVAIALSGLSAVFDWGFALHAVYIGLSLLALGRVWDIQI